jgi:hypothetical protein
MNNEPLYLGLKLYELITIAAIIVGPVTAVMIQLLTESRRRKQEQQTQTMRMLVSTRHMPSDPAYSTAINMVPIDFNGNKKVMAAWNVYIETIMFQPTPENVTTHDKKIVTKQTKLIFEIMKSLGYNLPETDIETTPYAASGFIARDNLMLDGWRAWPRIAAALETQTQLIGGSVSDDPASEPK